MSVGPGGDSSITIVMVVYNMAREAPRTLFSLSPQYQRDAETIDYDVVVVDNGSPRPLGEETVRAFGDRFRYVYVENAAPSPAQAINEAAAVARGSILGVMIDGARMLSPGVIRHAASAFRAFSQPVVNTLSFDLGPETQPVAMSRGYGAITEDALLSGIDWQQNGYRLFDVAVLSPSCAHGLFRPVAESNCVFLRTSLFEAIGGMSEAFDLPGGGFLNLDFYERANTAPGVTPVMLLGEATFHQVHGGASTTAASPELTAKIAAWRAHYERVRGKPYAPPRVGYEYIGYVPVPFLRTLSQSAEVVIRAEAARRVGDANAGTDVRSPAPPTGLRGLMGRWARTALGRPRR